MSAFLKGDRVRIVKIDWGVPERALHEIGVIIDITRQGHLVVEIDSDVEYTINGRCNWVCLDEMLEYAQDGLDRILEKI